MKHIKLLLLLSTCLYLFGCASGAKQENIVYRGMVSAQPEALKQNIAVDNVSGGQRTNPAWTSEISNEAFGSALKQSLAHQNLLGDNGRYRLKVELVNVDQPLFGLNATLNTSIRYTLVDRQTSQTVMSETVNASYTATIGDAFVGVTRLRLANEGSAKKNIQNFIERLSGLKLDAGQISLAQ